MNILTSNKFETFFQFVEMSLHFHQLFVSASLSDHPFLEHHYYVGVFDRIDSMSDVDASPILHHAVEGLLHLPLIHTIQC